MTFALTKFQAYGIYRDEPVTQKATQYMEFSITALNTDIDLDIGDFSGTFWTAVGATAPGVNALKAVKDLGSRYEMFLVLGGIGGRAQVDASSVGILALNSAAAAGGSATETYGVTGLVVATDTVLAVTQYVDGAGAAVGILSYGDANGQPTVAAQLPVVYNADPGAGAKVKVLISRTGVTTPVAGTYTVVMNVTNPWLPDILFASGDAPTSYIVGLVWVLKDNILPIKYSQSAA